MNRRALVAAAAAGGVVLAGGVAVARDDTPRRSASIAATTAPPPVVGLVPGEVVPDRSAGGRRDAIPGTDAIAARAADPQGGPPWVVRTFERASVDGRGRVRCAQLGRLVEGEVAWVMPGGRRAKRLPLAVTETTTCATTAPISEQLGVAIGGMPTRAVDDPAARIGATVLWGVIDGPAVSARVEHPDFGGAVKIRDHAILEVRRGPVAQSWTRLVVKDRDGGTRAAVPAGFFRTGHALVRIRVGARDDLRRSRPAVLPRDLAVPPATNFRLAASVGKSSDGPPSAIFARVGPRGESCVTGAVSAIGDQPAQLLGRNTGLVVQLPQECTPLPEWADWMPAVVGAGWASGFDDGERGTPAEATRLKRRNRDRIADESGSVTVGTPVGTRYLEVTSPVGVEVVRVTPGRVTTIAWQGQPEVRPALMPETRRLPGGRWKIAGPVVTFTAYDANWKQLGETGTTSATITWDARKRRAKRLREERRARDRAAGRPAATSP